MLAISEVVQSLLARSFVFVGIILAAVLLIYLARIQLCAVKVGLGMTHRIARMEHKLDQLAENPSTESPSIE